MEMVVGPVALVAEALSNVSSVVALI
jgi:hypothetical protein